MNNIEFWDGIPLWGIFLGTLMITLLSLEVGFQSGKWKRRSLPAEEKIQVGPFVAASLSMLAFMLAMVFSNVQTRSHQRMQVALDEARVTGSAYRAAAALPAAERAEVRQLLNDYVSLRVEALQDGTAQRLQQALDRSGELQSVLWSRAVTFADQHPTPVTSLFMQSVNKVIESHEKRITVSIHYRLPGILWIVLYGLLILANAQGGYASAMASRRRLIAITLSATLAFSVVLLLVVSLDRPHQQLSTVSYAAMLDLQESIRSMQAQP